ncbi:NADP-dependent 3-hydroxy acid dehydrogenase YdfG [Paraburkholderia sp. GAS333]|uniref:SDR family NAD(P)-dependent oxidoreductase n=1 Tax=Paraburkholderia sp. GAS333 TaxID=3156279 RepID=UPI003D23E9DF
MNQPVILITGALTGIGRATAFAFATSGARLVVSGRREAEGRTLEKELRELGADAHFIQADVRRDEEVANLVDQTVARFGRIDAAVNNAGTEGQPGAITNQTAESYSATFDTNVLGTLLSMKHELRVMSAQKSGSVVNISSTYGHEPSRHHCSMIHSGQSRGSRRLRSSAQYAQTLITSRANSTNRRNDEHYFAQPDNGRTVPPPDAW